MPKSWKQGGEAVASFRAYVSGLISEERDNVARGIQRNQHLVAALVRACQADKNADKKAQNVPGRRSMTLTEQEIISNLFVYAFAGNDTTAVALSHVIFDLAAHLEVQDWIAEEIQHFLLNKDISSWGYSAFPQLKRCLAVMVRYLESHNSPNTDEAVDGVTPHQSPFGPSS